MIRLNDHGAVDPDVFHNATEDERAALRRFRDVQLAKARGEHWIKYHAPRKHAPRKAAA